MKNEKISKALTVAQKFLPKTCIGLGIVGFGFCGYLVYKNTPKAMDVKKKCEDEEKSKMETAKDVALVYLPAIGVFTASVCSILAGYTMTSRDVDIYKELSVLNDKRAESYKEGYLKERKYCNILKSSVTNVAGEAVAKDILKNASEKISNEKTDEEEAEILETMDYSLNNDDSYLFQDSYTGRKFRATMSEIRGAILNMNQELQSDYSDGRASFVMFNRFFELIGIDGCDAGDSAAFIYDGENIDLIDFEPIPVMDGDEPCMIIDWNYRPEPFWMYYDGCL